MTSIRIMVERLSPDELHRKTWRFAVIDKHTDDGDRLFVVVDEYTEEQRASKRQKLKLERKYTRLRSSPLDRTEVPLPDDVAAEARQKVNDLLIVAIDF